MSLPDWLSLCAGGVLLTVHVQPGARQTAAAGVHGDALKVRLQAPPVDGKANAALLAYLAAALGISPRQLTLVAGQTSRRKRVRVEGVAADELLAALAGET